MADVTQMTPSTDGGATISVGQAVGSVAQAAIASIPPQARPCSFELDVQWIIDIVDKVDAALRRFGEMAEQALGVIGSVLDAISGILDFFVTFTGIGKFAKDHVKELCDLAGRAINFISNLQADVMQFCLNALAPWEIRSAGRQINEQIVPRSADLAESLKGHHLASNSSWTGDAAERFRSGVERQSSFADQLSSGTEEFGSVVEQMGDDAVQATIDFVSNFTKAAIALVSAIIKVAAVPVGTAVAAKDVIALVLSIIEMVKVWVEAVTAVISQTAQLRSAAQSAAPGGEWPSVTA